MDMYIDYQCIIEASQSNSESNDNYQSDKMYGCIGEMCLFLESHSRPVKKPDTMINIPGTENSMGSLLSRAIREPIGTTLPSAPKTAS
jgi:hypothetical protein